MRIVDLPVISHVASLFMWVESLCAALLARVKQVANNILFTPAQANAPKPMQEREVVPEDRVSNEAAKNIEGMNRLLGGHLTKKREDNAFLYALNQQLKALLLSQNSQTVRTQHKSGGQEFTVAGLIQRLPVTPQNAKNASLQTQVHAEAAQCREILSIYELLQNAPTSGALRERIQELPTDNEALQQLKEA